MTVNKNVSWRGLTDIAVSSNPASGAGSWIDWPNAVDMSIDLSMAKVEQRGDDRKIRTWFHSPGGTCRIRASGMSQDVLNVIFNQSVNVNGASEEYYFNTNKTLDSRLVCIKGTANAVNDANDASVTLLFYCLKARCSNPNTINLNEGVGMMEFLFDLESSTTREDGTALPTGITEAMVRSDIA